MAKSYKEFKDMYIGRSVDVDGFPVYNIYQCWDLVSGKYFPYIGGKQISCGGGYVCNIANQRKTNGILDFCEDIGLKATLQPGDVCIWAFGSAACPLSHIAIYDHDEGQDHVWFLGQNQPFQRVTLQEISVKGIIGVFRPKIFVGVKPVKPAKKTADQWLTVGSRCRSEGWIVQRLDIRNGMWMAYNNWVGGWVPLKHIHEVDKRDGKQDNVLHVGSGVAFDGTMTVGIDPKKGYGVDVKNDTVFIKEFGYWVKSRCLYELEDGK